MVIVHVFMEVKPEFREKFINETITNAQASLQEPGIARFDFIQDVEDVNKFTLVEVYRSQSDKGKHKETSHYQHWSDVVREMMAVPRSKRIFTNILPSEEGWDSA